MKRIAFFLFFLLALWVVVRNIRSSEMVSPAVSLTPSPSASAKPLFGLAEQEDTFTPLEVGGETFRVAWLEASNVQTVTVGINDRLASSSAMIQEANRCAGLTSGGFYDESGEPMGLLVSDGATLSAWKKNQLFDGVIGYDSTQQRVVMETGTPTYLYQWAVQAGPILWQEGMPTAFQLKSDQPARRLVAILTTDNKLLLGVVVANDSLFGGPQLSQMGSVLAAWQTMLGTTFRSVLNLDGGTASTYYSPTLKLKELKPIGSWICTK